jgi:glycosyltransferase involved in cell wall biosynthesis
MNSSPNAPRKSLLWIDAHIEYRSPTMRHLLHAIPRLRAEGWEIKAWCLRSDASRDDVEHTTFPSARWLGPFELLYFTAIVNLYGLWRWMCGRPRPAEIIHATCGTYFGADVTSVHFLNCVWAATQLRIGFSGWRDVARYPFTLLGMCVERLQWWSPALRLALAVSDSVAAEVRTRTRAKVKVETLPNSYDETRFNPAARVLYRDLMRAKLGFGAEHRVFCFVSTGHYKRKGFWLAVEALAAVRKTNAGKHARLLAVGGSEDAIARLRSEIQQRFPGAEEWIVFAGMQPEVEKFYAASDAFIFPSYFEAFCLAEIEAAACGLPLLLTPHHGSEMILCDGENGRLLSFDPQQMAGQIEDFLAKGLPAFQPSVGRGLTKGEYTAALIAAYERMTGGRRA